MEKRRRRTSKKKRQARLSKFLVVCIVLSNAIVMGVCLWLLDRTGMEAAALAGLWFGWTTVELGFLKSITTTKEKAKVKEKQMEYQFGTAYNDEAEEA